ncbi:MAG: 3-isopropylmalate dehydrogenase, partial [Alphaproteobacteria bacterium]|nr:3-isopropylmalate dehydrogenase [Alphaproteobacteria bacterium]
FAMPQEADAVERAVKAVLDQGLRTADIMQPGMRKLSTGEMGDAVAMALEV